MGVGHTTAGAAAPRDREPPGGDPVTKDAHRHWKKGIVMADSDPAALERDIERTRAELARTIDAIADRVSPKRVAERSVARMKANAGQLVASVGDLVTGNAYRPVDGAPRDGADDGRPQPPPDLAPILIGVGAVLVVGAAFVLLRRRRRRR